MLFSLLSVIRTDAFFFLSIHVVMTELKEQESIVDEITDRTDRAVNNMEDVNREVTKQTLAPRLTQKLPHWTLSPPPPSFVHAF